MCITFSSFFLPFLLIFYLPFNFSLIFLVRIFFSPLHFLYSYSLFIFSFSLISFLSSIYFFLMYVYIFIIIFLSLPLLPLLYFFSLDIEGKSNPCCSLCTDRAQVQREQKNIVYFHYPWLLNNSEQPESGIQESSASLTKGFVDVSHKRQNKRDALVWRLSVPNTAPGWTKRLLWINTKQHNH